MDDRGGGFDRGKLRCESGGEHPERGTRNALISLGTGGGCKLIGLNLLDPEPQGLAAAVQPLRLNVKIEEASQRALEVVLDCAAGKVALR